jgi:hypothetical protein
VGIMPLTEENKKALRAFFDLANNKKEYAEMRKANKLITDTADMVNRIVNSETICS